ncbi:MAG: hypothetical protein V4466_14455, partial [Pseudomonadota bacterium]
MTPDQIAPIQPRWMRTNGIAAGWAISPRAAEAGLEVMMRCFAKLVGSTAPAGAGSRLLMGQRKAWRNRVILLQRADRWGRRRKVFKRPEVSLPEDLRDRLALGRPVDAVLNSYHAIEACAVHEPEALAAALDEAARLDLSQALSSHIPRRALGVAVVSRDARIWHADATFTAWFGGGDDPAFRRLVQLAARGAPASGLVEARDGAVIAACAGRAVNASRWPLPVESLAALTAGPDRLALLGFAPSRISDLADKATAAFGLTPLESRLAEALLYAPTLEAAADRVGVGRETARDAIRNAQRKSGARRTPDLIRQMLDMMCGERPDSPDLGGLLVSAFGLTAAEARAAAALAGGLDTREASAALAISQHTLRGHMKAVYAKSGVTRIKDLVRLTIE